MGLFSKNKVSFKLGIDKDTGKIITIENAQNGLKCNCICSDCKAPFEAIQGQKNEWHFRHCQNSECKGGQETALHKLAKEIICRNSSLVVLKNKIINYTYPEIEKYVAKDINPDVVAILNNERICFEIVVKNPFTREKKMKYYRDEIKCIEVDLSEYEFISEKELEHYLIKTPNNKKIVFWGKPKLPELDLSTLWKFIFYPFIGFLIYKIICIFTKSKK